MKIRYAPLALACAWMVAAATTTTAQAASVTYTFGGTLDSVARGLPFLAVGDSFIGSFTFESTSPDVSASAGQSIYPEGFSINATVNGYSFSSNSNLSDCPACGDVAVANDSNTFSDIFFVKNNAGFAAVTGPHVNGFVPYDLTVQLFDFSGVVFNSNALPSNLVLSAFDYRRFSISFLDANGNGTGAGGALTDLTLVTAAPVPEASTSAMLALGLGALAVVRRRKVAA